MVVFRCYVCGDVTVSVVLHLIKSAWKVGIVNVLVCCRNEPAFRCFIPYHKEHLIWSYELYEGHVGSHLCFLGNGVYRVIIEELDFKVNVTFEGVTIGWRLGSSKFQYIHHAFPSVGLPFYLLILCAYKSWILMPILFAFIVIRKLYSPKYLRKRLSILHINQYHQSARIPDLKITGSKWHVAM